MTETSTQAATPPHALEPSVHDPIHRVAYAFAREADELWVYSWMEPGAHLPEHFHPSLDEHWEALDGALRAKIDGTWRDLRPEDGPALVARNVRHELRNESGRPARARARVVPGGRLEEFLTETARAAEEGLYNARNMPTSWRGLVWAAEISQRFRDETVMCSPPPALQRIFAPAVARFAR